MDIYSNYFSNKNVRLPFKVFARNKWNLRYSVVIRWIQFTDILNISEITIDVWSNSFYVSC